MATSPNMGLPIPGVGVTSGPQWAEDVNSCLSIIDTHDHTPGYGVQITPDGININSELPFNSQDATMLRSVRFDAQASPISDPSDLGCLYESGVDLYYNDGNGNQVRITQSGGVAGSPGSIANLSSPASASYVSAQSKFVWQSDSNEAAAMDNGAVTIRETGVASSNGVTIQAPAALGSNYSLTLPTALPGSTSAVNVTSSGVLSTISYDGIGSGMTSVGANAIGASMTSTGADAVAATMTATGANAILADVSSVAATQANLIHNARTTTVGTSVSAGNVAFSSNCGLFTTTTSGSWVAVTNLSVTLTSTGRPVVVMLVANTDETDPSFFGADVNTNTSTDVAGGLYHFLRGSTEIGAGQVRTNVCDTSALFSYYGLIRVPVSGCFTITVPAAGSYTYSCEIRSIATNTTKPTVRMYNAHLMAYEL